MVKKGKYQLDFFFERGKGDTVLLFYLKFLFKIPGLTTFVQIFECFKKLKDLLSVYLSFINSSFLCLLIVQQYPACYTLILRTALLLILVYDLKI